MSSLKHLLASHLPSVVREPLRRRFGAPPMFDDTVGGWEAAQQASAGYQDPLILERVLATTLRVQSGAAAFERDSVEFAKAEFVWPVVAALMTSAASSGGRLRVCDFGGALGSTYFQHLPLLRDLVDVTWGVVEQPHFVRAGREHVHSPGLCFFESLEECLAEVAPDLIVFGSSLQYQRDPRRLLQLAASSGARFLLVDRTPVTSSSSDVCAIQRVPSAIYPASYPAWLFSEQAMSSTLEQDWEVLGEFDSLGGTTITVAGESVSWHGWSCRRLSGSR